MHVIRARNVNDALVKGVALIKNHAVPQKSRYGDTLEVPEPVCTVYEKPLERVLFSPERDANPFFHLMESLWMLAGRCDVEWLARFNGKMREFSDDGVTFNAAYGYRWRKHFGYDQLNILVGLLQKDPNSRRAVLQIWDNDLDLAQPSKDIACNTQAMFKIRDGKLNMTVSNRSNDMIWGCYGANVVQFSTLLEYLAARIGVKVGVYRQISDSFHVYLETWPKVEILDTFPHRDDYTQQEQWGDLIGSFSLVSNPKTFDEDLYEWMKYPDALSGTNNPFFSAVATPLYLAWFAHKDKRIDLALGWARRCAAPDWQRAAIEWLQRRDKSNG